MCLGKWWSLNNQNNLDNHRKILQEMNILHENSEIDKNENTKEENDKDKKGGCCRHSTNELKYLYPFNSVHGYVNLDEDGNFLKSDSNVPPRYVHIVCLYVLTSCINCPYFFHSSFLIFLLFTFVSIFFISITFRIVMQNIHFL